MGKVIITRAVPFRRGDESISIFMDGKAVGSLLLNSNSVSIDVPPGKHKLKPTANGRYGKEYPIDVVDEAPIHLQVQNLPQKTYWWDWIPTFLIIGFPSKAFGDYAYYILISVCLITLALLIFVRVPQMRNRLRIEPATKQEIAGEVITT